MDDGRWTMDDGRWTMDDGRWTMDDGVRIAPGSPRCRIVHRLPLGNRPSSIVYRLSSTIAPYSLRPDALLFEQLYYGPAVRASQARGYVREGAEHEGPLPHPGVGHRQALSVDAPVFVQ